MIKPVTFTTPSGDQMAVIPLAEYQRLVAAAEDRADVAAYDRAMARLANGHDEMIPAEIAERILDGESPVRVWREHREMSLNELAGAAGISVPYLSQIETGARAGRGRMKQIAAALRVSLDDL